MFTGVRRGEALALTWGRVDRSRGVVRLELTKSGRRREVPLSSNADGVLARRWTPRHLASDHLRAAVAMLDGVLSSPESEPTKGSAQ
jgi:integrase